LNVTAAASRGRGTVEESVTSTTAADDDFDNGECSGATVPGIGIKHVVAVAAVVLWLPMLPMMVLSLPDAVVMSPMLRDIVMSLIVVFQDLIIDVTIFCVGVLYSIGHLR
jgi:hypothetical protein